MMLFTLLFIIATISERLLNIEIGPIRLSLGDMVVLLSLPYCIVFQGKIKSIFLSLALFSFIVILISIFFNHYNYGFNTLVSVPLRVISAGVIANELIQLRRPKIWRVVCIALYSLSVLSALFLSDGGPFKVIEIFNRNELLCYSVLFVLLALYSSFNHNLVSSKSVSKRYILILFVLITVAGLIGSRQNILALFVSFFVLVFYLRSKQKIVAGIMIFCLVAVAGTFISLKIISDVRMSARVRTISEFEPATRADKYRLANIEQAIKGVQRSPIYGSGPTSFRRNNQLDKVAHSTPFSVAYELGVLGLFFLFAIFWNVLRFPLYLLRVMNPHPTAIVFASMMPVVIIQSFFIELLPKAPLYVYLALSVAALSIFKSCESVTYKKSVKLFRKI